MHLIIGAFFQGLISLGVWFIRKFAPHLIAKYLTRAVRVGIMLGINILILGASITYFVGLTKALLFIHSQIDVIFNTINQTSDSYFVWCMQILSALGIVSAFYDFWTLMGPLFSSLFFMLAGRFGISLLKSLRDNLMYIFVSAMR